MATPETRRQLLAAVQACDDKKGEDTRILELDPADSGLADFFLITSASNDRQVVAIADEIELRLKKDFGLYATSVEGRRQGEWILLDYVDIVIHVFLAEKRAFYDIERLRKSARPLTSAELEAELKAALAEKTRAVRDSSPKAAKKSAKATKTSPAKSSPASKAAKSKASSQGDTTVPAKPALKKASKSTAKKAAPKPQASSKASPKAGKELKAKAASPKAAPKAAKKSAPVKAKAAAASAAAPLVQGVLGAKPPIVKCEPPPELLSMAASAAKKSKAAPKPKAPVKPAFIKRTGK